MLQSNTWKKRDFFMHQEYPLFQYSLPGWLASVHHDGSGKYVSNPKPKLGERVKVRLRIEESAPVKRVYLRTFPDGEQAIAPMQRECIDPPTQWWQAELIINQHIVNYRFIILSEDGVWFYSASGASVNEPLDHNDFRLLAGYQTPSWLAESVFYQIFADRFFNGDPDNDPHSDEFEYSGHQPKTYPWGMLPSDDHFLPIVFYGGDLQGITQRLSYLQQLGVNALYLTPIFTAHTNHKYDVTDYNHIDPHFGGDEALVVLRQALDERNMRYIMDIVPNHAGFWHPWFQAARDNPDVLEAEFFTFNTHPDDYASWLGVWSLPKLNYNSLELRRRIYAGTDSVFRSWLRPPFSTDGWRVDVANMLARQGADQMGDEVARGIRQAVKQTNPEAYLIGENFFDASSQLQGDEWDGVMNYAGFKRPLLSWISGYHQGAFGLKGTIDSPVPWPTLALAATWIERLAAIPWVVALQQYNLLDSHDTRRIRSMVNGNDALHRMAAIVQFTYPGIPGIYYGDEIGMVDVPKLAQRGCMVWNEAAWDTGLLAFYQDLIRLRRTSPVLQHGGFQILAVEQDLIAYQREGLSESILVIAQRSPIPRQPGKLPAMQAGIPDGTRFVEHFTGKETVVLDGFFHLPELDQGGSLWEQIM